MRIIGNIVALVLLLVGGLWMLQGANIVGGSIMSGQGQWLWAGLALVVVSVCAFWWANSRRVRT